MFVSYTGCVEIAARLISNGAKPNLQNKVRKSGVACE